MLRRSRHSDTNQETEDVFARRISLFSGALVLALSVLGSGLLLTPTMAAAQDKPAPAAGKQPNIVMIWATIRASQYQRLLQRRDGLSTPNIDRVAKEGMIFTDYYGEQSCTAGRSSFIPARPSFVPA